MSTSTRGRRKASRVKLKRNSTVDGLTVEEPFSFSSNSNGANGEEEVGEGCYISGIIGGKKYYGILIEQGALSAATDMFFKSEGRSLEMNRRMMTLRDQQVSKKNEDSDAKDGNVEGPAKKARIEKAPENSKEAKKQVQKFRYVDSSKMDELGGPGYRDLIATYADENAASEDNEDKAAKIKEACDIGGNYVEDYYYQYEMAESTLHLNKKDVNNQSAAGKFDIWSSIGFHTFLSHTPFPSWFPLSNKSGQQRRVLQMLNMEHKNAGVAWNADNMGNAASSVNPNNLPRLLPMQPRSHFRIGIIGGGISGLASAHQLLRLAQSQKIDVEVVLLEARDRLGGRLNTDYNSFKSTDNTSFPIDLGGSWIHGIDKNPLSALAMQANIQFVPTSEDVKMLEGKMTEVDKNIDAQAAKLFDDILDAAAEQCWAEPTDPDSAKSDKLNKHNAIRWYASILNTITNTPSSIERPEATQVQAHRYSADIAIDAALSQVVHKRADLRDQLSNVEKNLLLWNTKNLEYALAGNIRDLSMKYWDASDAEHEFKGDHVLLKQGYSAIINHILQKCKTYSNFKYELNFVIQKIEYARRTTNIPYLKQHDKNIIKLSDTCCVTSTQNKGEAFDFLISSLPLGVLKNRFREGSTSAPQQQPTQPNNNNNECKILFQPSLPFWKSDSIDTTGFGLLNKVILQFPVAFWRRNVKREFLRGTPFLGEEQFLIGNASGKNSEHYIFYDLGKCLSDNLDTAPPILMTLISGLDAVISEQLTKEKLVISVMETLKHLYNDIHVPQPTIAVRTLWGSDPYSRGSYTFLPPGATNEDYQMLQYPINENSESYAIDETDTMRLFWCGEHTTSFHPSTAHGAYLSGLRAAKEVIDSMFTKDKTDNRNERQIPLLYYRLKHPDVSLDCHMCKKSGSRSIEGPLLAFQRANRRILMHMNCAKYTPDVMIVGGAWRNMFKALNRAKQLRCNLCKKTGASIGCINKDCNRSYHYHCCLETGWTFNEKDIHFHCDTHRSKEFLTNDAQESVISIDFFRSKNPFFPPQCFFCAQNDQTAGAGKLLAFQLGAGQILVHEKCLRYSNVVPEGTWSENTENYFNVFKSFNSGRNCIICNKDTATIKCAKCSVQVHYPCAVNSGWDLEKDPLFLCQQHRPQRLLESATPKNVGIQHNLFNPTISSTNTSNETSSSQVNHKLLHSSSLVTTIETPLQPKHNLLAKHNLFNTTSLNNIDDIGASLSIKHDVLNPSISTTATNEAQFEAKHNLFTSLNSTNDTSMQANHNLLDPLSSSNTSNGRLAQAKHNLSTIETTSRAKHNLFATLNTTNDTSLQDNHNLLNPSSSSTTANVICSQTKHNLLNPVSLVNTIEASSQVKHDLLSVPSSTNDTSSLQAQHNLFHSPPSVTTSQTSLQATNAMPAAILSQSMPAVTKGASSIAKTISSTPLPKPPTENNCNIVKIFTLDPCVDAEIGSTYIVFKALNARRATLTQKWGISLTIYQTGMNNNTTTLRIPLQPPSNVPASTPPPYGLNRGDIILEVNGIKLGSPDLMSMNQLQNLMKSVLVLQMLIVRKPDVQDSSLV